MKANHRIRSPDGRSQLWLNFLPHGHAAELLRVELTAEKWQLLTCWHGRRFPFLVAWLVRPGELISLAVKDSSHKSREGKWWRLTRHLSWTNEDVAHEKDKDCRRAASSGPLKLTDVNFWTQLLSLTDFESASAQVTPVCYRYCITIMVVVELKTLQVVLFPGWGQCNLDWEWQGRKRSW